MAMVGGAAEALTVSIESGFTFSVQLVAEG
jgi:hypothetical protein